jgi:hypothetical protein
MFVCVCVCVCVCMCVCVCACVHILVCFHVWFRSEMASDQKLAESEEDMCGDACQEEQDTRPPNFKNVSKSAKYDLLFVLCRWVYNCSLGNDH